ncbi:Hypothetical protein PHPALM_1423 [Phytophthora palmivora]|uniref:Uncharacterized protein n=1 Tax=Phytophthora palmivora TaxID=4796 RepID=A0A2P4YSC4_9STRA|nr:Hypothetical protein PHPALM_1423 [Phytophthora palmivora]
MLPPIFKSTNGLLSERRGSGIDGNSVNDSIRKQTIAAGLSSPSRIGQPVFQPNGVSSVGASSSFSPVLDRMAERLYTLERENEHFRGEIQRLRQFYSNNQQQHEDDKFSVGKVAEDLQRLAHSFNSKLQADTSHQQREQHKAALLFAEVARLGHRVDGLESELRGIVDDTSRKFEAQEKHAQFMASVSSKQQQQSMSPSRNAELQRQLRDMQDTMVQLRNELDADRSARWKNDAAIDAKLDSQLERLTSKLTTDKRDIARVLDEQRQLVTGADFQRVTSHMREFSRVNDHLIALERWVHSEFGQIKRVFQALAGDVDGRFQCVLVELTNSLKLWHAAQARQEDELGLRFKDLEEAVRLVTTAVQRKLSTLEEVIPLEVQARQKNDDKLRRRVEGVVKSLGHAFEASRGEYLPQQSTLLDRVHQLELAQRHTSEEVDMQVMFTQRVSQLELAQQNTSDEISIQHNAMRETIQSFMEDSDAMLVRLAAAVEQERIKGIQLVTAREEAQLEIPAHIHEELVAELNHLKEELNALQTWTTTHTQECSQFVSALPMAAPAIGLSTVSMHTTEDTRAETKVMKEEVDALQAWMTMHAQECRQFFYFLNWSVDDARRENAVVQCLDAVIDQIIETQACGHLNTLAKGVNGVLRKLAVGRVSSTMKPALPLTAVTTALAAKHDRPSRTHYTLQLPHQGHPLPAESSAQSPISEGATDMLDLSTTTYLASTDREIAINGVQGELQLRDFAQPYNADRQNPANTKLRSPSHPSHQLNDDPEDVYSMDMTQDEMDAIVPHSSSVAHHDPHNAQNSDQLLTPDPVALQDEGMPLTLDL